MSSNLEVTSGNEAAAKAICQINPDVIAAFPITPSTEIPQLVSSYIANGKMTTEFITVESEHSAMSAVMGAEASGVRAMTATSSAGLAFMYELLWVAASDRLPLVMAVVNRALTGLLNINADHSDSFGAKDSGFIQIYSENAQEAYDNLLQAHRIAEDENVLLPLMVCQDGFITSHASTQAKFESDEFVKDFIGKYSPSQYLLNEEESASVGPYGNSPFYMEMKYAENVAMKNAIPVIEKVGEDFYKKTGRKYGLFEEYKLDDADFAFVLMGSSAGACKDAIDKMRTEGKKVGLLKIRSFRPFPYEKIINALAKVKAIAVLDRSEKLSTGEGEIAEEIKTGFFNEGLHTKIHSYYYGLGGRDITVPDFENVLMNLKNEDKIIGEYIGLRK